MRFLALGYGLDSDGITTARFSASTSCLDFDVVYWDPGSIFDEYPVDRKHEGLPSIAEHASAQALADTERRRNEFSDLMRLGRSLIVVTSPPAACYVDTGKRQYSGTGRNRVTTSLVDRLDFLSALPVQVTAEAARGSQISLTGGEPYASFWRRNEESFYYKAYFKEPAGTVWAVVDGTDRGVASVVTTPEGGVLLFVPAILLPDDAVLEDTGDQTEGRFIDSLIELLSEIRATEGEFALPAWAGAYRSTAEGEARHQQEEARAVVTTAEKNLAEATRALAAEEQKKVLMVGTGRALELAVAHAFETLGCKVETPDLGRDDLVLHHRDRPGVVEVKGVGGSSAEKHAAQLEKWVSGYFEAHETQPKPILVVNAFKDTPLTERSDAVFPDQMLDYSVRRGHCLISTVQLMGMVLSVEQGEANPDDLVDRVYETVGPFEGYSDWSEFLKAALPVKDSEVIEKA